ncbi:MAG: T9SS type A sorting domain-containing protein, partial [Bacteroidota bacterium]
TYTDQNPPAGTQYYQIAAIKPTPCDPYSQAKLTAIEMDRSVSNIRATSGSNIDEIVSCPIDIIPNPNDGTFSIVGVLNPSSTVKIEITDVNGELIFAEKLESTSRNFSRNYDLSLGTGVYLVKIISDKSQIIKKLIIQ